MLATGLQFYAMFVVILSGAFLGLLFDLLRALRGYFQPGVILGAIADLLFWGVATVAFSGALFYGNWGEIRFYVLVGLLLGIGLYYYLASPLVLRLTRLLIGTIEWILDLLVKLILRIVWAPILALAGLLWSTALLLWRWLSQLAEWLWDALLGLLELLARLLNGPHRFMRLHYLLTKRRIRRWLRSWLLGSPHGRRR